MSYQLAPNPKFLSPDYWNGIDINNPDNFTGVSELAVYLQRREERVAANVLRACLSEVMTGDYTETKSHMRPEFDPTTSQLDDGTVLIIDREHLMKWSYPPSAEQSWKQ